MELQERVYSVLIVSASEKFQNALRSLLPESAYSPIVTAASVGAAERARNGQDFDFVFVQSMNISSSSYGIFCIGFTFFLTNALLHFHDNKILALKAINNSFFTTINLIKHIIN